jgi:peptidoglycan hydrolase-like protein with peptidoglycan-binding domain
MNARPIGRAALAMALAGSLAALSACDDQRTEKMARDAAEKVQSALQSKSEAALQQKASAEDVKQAQEVLTASKEYMGEINGKLDAVTVNAIQAFQRTKGLSDDGILNAETKKLLSEVKGSKPAS